MQILLASGSPEGTARFNKADKLNLPSLSSASQYGAWRDGWIRATEDVEGMPALWTLIARRTRTDSGHVPDIKSMTSDSVGIRQLLGREADMSSAQLAMLDSLEGVVGALEGFGDPDEFLEGDWLEVFRGRVDVEPMQTPGYRPATDLDEEGQNPATGGPVHTSPWQSLVANAASLDEASEGEGVPPDVRQALQEQARSQIAIARGMEAAEARALATALAPDPNGPV